MKRTATLALALILCLTMLMPLTALAAPSASATLTGPGTVRAGDTITLTFNLNGQGLSALTANLSYDKSQLELLDYKCIGGGAWMLEVSDAVFLAYDNDMSSLVNGNKGLFTLRFKVKDLAVGTDVKVSFTETTATDNIEDAVIGTVTYSAKIAAPKSGNAALGSLSVKDVTLSPAFNADTTTYTASVPFSVSKLDIKATAADSKATVTVSGNNLTPGATTNVTVTVTAENGAKKTYTIKVTRAQDPNYTPSKENDLSSMRVDGFLLSPVFDPDVTKYLVWLPYETEKITVYATAKDSKASIEVISSSILQPGKDNEIKVVCTAEDGTAQTYIIIAKRAAAHGSEDTPGTDTPGTDTPGTDKPGTDTPGTDKPGDDQPNTDKPSGGMPWWVAVITLVVGLAGGWLICTLLNQQRGTPYISRKR